MLMLNLTKDRLHEMDNGQSEAIESKRCKRQHSSTERHDVVVFPFVLPKTAVAFAVGEESLKTPCPTIVVETKDFEITSEQTVIAKDRSCGSRNKRFDVAVTAG